MGIFHVATPSLPVFGSSGAERSGADGLMTNPGVVRVGFFLGRRFGQEVGGRYKVGPYLVVNEVITRISRVITPVTQL